MLSESYQSPDCSAELPPLMWTEKLVHCVGQYMVRTTDKPDHLEQLMQCRSSAFKGTRGAQVCEGIQE